jgi:hypothetical protein
MSAYPVYLIESYGSRSPYDQAAFRGVVRLPREELLDKVEGPNEDAVEIELSGSDLKEGSSSEIPSVDQTAAPKQKEA